VARSVNWDPLVTFSVTVKGRKSG